MCFFVYKWWREQDTAGYSASTAIQHQPGVTFVFIPPSWSGNQNIRARCLCVCAGGVQIHQRPAHVTAHNIHILHIFLFSCFAILIYLKYHAYCAYLIDCSTAWLYASQSTIVYERCKLLHQSMSFQHCHTGTPSSYSSGHESLRDDVLRGAKRIRGPCRCCLW